MKNFNFIFLISLIPFSFFAQNGIDLLKGESIASAPGHTGAAQIFENKDGGYSWMTLKPRTIEFGFNQINAELTSVENANVVPILMSGYACLVMNVELNGKIYSLISDFDKETITEKLIAFQWNDDHSGFVGDGREIITVAGSKLASHYYCPTLMRAMYMTAFQNGKYHFVESKDKKTLTIIYDLVEDSKSKDHYVHNIVVFDDKLDEIYTKKQTFTKEEGIFENSTRPYYYISNGELFAIQYLESRSEIVINHISEKSENEYSYNLNTLGMFKLSFDVLDNGDFSISIINGYEKEKMNRNYKNFQQLDLVIFNVADKKFTEVFNYTFQKEDYSLNLGSRVESLKKGNFYKNAKEGLYNPDVTNVYLRKDGGYFIIIKQSYYYSNGQESNTSDLNQIVISLSAKGDFISLTHLPLIIGIPGISMVKSFFYNDEAYIFYYDHPLNKSKTGIYTPELLTPGQFFKQTDFTVAKINEQGEVNKTVIARVESKEVNIPYVDLLFEIKPGVYGGDLWHKKKISYREDTPTSPFIIKL